MLIELGCAMLESELHRAAAIQPLRVQRKLDRKHPWPAPVVASC
jgi:hypothetical protein